MVDVQHKEALAEAVVATVLVEYKNNKKREAYSQKERFSIVQYNIIERKKKRRIWDCSRGINFKNMDNVNLLTRSVLGQTMALLWFPMVAMDEHNMSTMMMMMRMK